MQSLCPPVPLSGLYGGVGADCALHPLIHTSARFAHAQDVENKKAEPKLQKLRITQLRPGHICEG
jgi:hypothetical protein